MGRASTSRLEPTADGTVTWWTGGDPVGAGLAVLGVLGLAAVAGGRARPAPGAGVASVTGVSFPACLAAE